MTIGSCSRRGSLASVAALVLVGVLSGPGSAVAAGSAPFAAPGSALVTRDDPRPQRARPAPTNVTPDGGNRPTKPATLPQPVPNPLAPPPKLPRPVAVTTLRPGMRSAAVQTMQTRLAQLGFWLSTADGSYGPTTSQAVMALQKASGLSRSGVADPSTLAALRRGVRLAPRSTSGHVLEVDLQRQLLMVVDGGVVSTVFNTSTGSGQWYQTNLGGRERAVTPRGSFRISRQITGWHRAPLGMLYSPKFFVGGYALHGSLSIPGYPASHGCARLSVAAMDHLWRMRLAQIGTQVLVY